MARVPPAQAPVGECLQLVLTWASLLRPSSSREQDCAGSMHALARLQRRRAGSGACRLLLRLRDMLAVA